MANVVLWIGDEIVDEAHWETVYVGATRAKSLLAVVGSHKALNSDILIRSENRLAPNFLLMPTFFSFP